MRRFWKYSFLTLVSLVISANGWAGTDCISEDDEAYTLYVYENTDAKVLLDQKCETTSGESQMEKTLIRAECRCYDTKVSDVMSRLLSSGGPVAVTTRKAAGIYNGLTCKEALKKCAASCEEIAKTAPKSCSTIQTAGVSAY